MKDETFVAKVKKYFNFLESLYGYKIIHAKNSEVMPNTDGAVKYASSTTLILIDSETGQAAVRFTRIHDDERYALDPVYIHEYLNTSEQEKQILLSKDIKNKDAAKIIFNKTFLLTSSEWRDDQGKFLIDLEKQLENYADWLKRNAYLCLLGDFSKWPAFYEYKINRMIADEVRRGGKEVVKALIKDENGKHIMVERPIFQREKDYLTQLQQEILGK